jgi:ABC-type cobalt transport system substrate-binding protein
MMIIVIAVPIITISLSSAGKHGYQDNQEEEEVLRFDHLCSFLKIV